MKSGTENDEHDDPPKPLDAAGEVFAVSESEPLSRAELEAYGRLWGSGHQRRASCPFCDHPRRDYAHASLAFNADTGAWVCHRCNRSGLLEEFKTLREEAPRKRRHGGPPPRLVPMEPPGRRCSCGQPLSRYNRDTVCELCLTQRRAEEFHGDLRSFRDPCAKPEP